MNMIQRFSLPGRKYFCRMYLRTVKDLLRLFSSLEAGQLAISPSKKDNIYAWKSHCRQSFLYKYIVRKRRKAYWKKSWIRWGTCLLNQLPMHH